MPRGTVPGVSGVSCALAGHDHCVTGLTLALCPVGGLLSALEAAKPPSGTMLSLHALLSTVPVGGLVGHMERVRGS